MEDIKKLFMKDILFIYGENLSDYRKSFLHSLKGALIRDGYNPIGASNLIDASEIIKVEPHVVSVIFDWESYDLHSLEKISQRNYLLPIFAVMTNRTVSDLSLQNLKFNLDFLQYDNNLLGDDLERIILAVNKYVNMILPPFTKQLMQLVEENKYLFCCPGHLGGTAFQKTPVGTLFYNFYGSNAFTSDICTSVTALGSLLDHTKAHKEAEEYIADVFGSDRSLIITNGTSTSNKVVGMYSAGNGDIVLVDRNCHKSVAHYMMMTDVWPIYMNPVRNVYGILGGIPISELEEKSIQEKISKLPKKQQKKPVYAVITTSTYDGIIHNTDTVKRKLDVKNLHFDSAWIPHAPFHPIYAAKYGVYKSVADRKEQVIFETISNHKLLAAFSQTSLINVRGDYDQELLNETYMMHTTTSHFYGMVASCEVSAAMMKGQQGYNLLNDAIKISIDFRKQVKALKESCVSWFFDVWQPDVIEGAECWELKSGEKWHGLDAVDPNHIFLDPTKITLLTPGIKDKKMEKTGIPAIVVSKFLETYGVISEKTGPYSMLFLFSIGMTKAKSMKLLSLLDKFKYYYDQNILVKTLLPELYAQYPNFYSGMRIQELVQGLHALFTERNFAEIMYHAFEKLPQIYISPHQAFMHLVKHRTKTVRIKDMLNEVSAVMLLPYPPGVPLILPGECITEETKGILDFLLMLEAIGEHFPGFETDIHGVEIGKNGKLYVKVLDQDKIKGEL
jgi:lysine decarboxylase